MQSRDNTLTQARRLFIAVVAATSMLFALAATASAQADTRAQGWKTEPGRHFHVWK